MKLVVIKIAQENKGGPHVFARVGGNTEVEKIEYPFCYYCGCRLLNVSPNTGHPQARTSDHIIPLSSGVRCTPYNRAPACSECNNAKRSFSLLHFLLAKPYGVSITPEIEYLLGIRNKNKPPAHVRRLNGVRWQLVRVFREYAGMPHAKKTGSRHKRRGVRKKILNPGDKPDPV